MMMQLVLLQLASTSAVSFRSDDPPMLLLPPEPAAVALQARVSSSITAGDARFVVPPAEYYFNNASLVLSYAKHFTLVGGGSELWFSVGSGLLLHRCVSTTVTGFSIDYDPPAFFQATALADGVLSGKTASVKMMADTGFLGPHVFQRIYGHNSQGGGTDAANEFTQGPQWWRGQGEDINNWALVSQGFENFNATTMVGPLASDGSFVYTQTMAQPPRKGDKVTAIIRQGYTVLLHNSSKCAIENVTLYSASFMAVTEFDGKGSNRYSDLRVVRRNVTSADQLCATMRSTSIRESTNDGGGRAGRLCQGMIASNADIFHSSGAKRGPMLERCEFTVAMDDYLNVHSRAQLLVSSQVNGVNTKLLVLDGRLARDRGMPDDLLYGTVETMPNAAVGDVLSFFSPAQGTLKKLGTAKITAVERVSDVWLIAQAKAAVGKANAGPSATKADPALMPVDVDTRNVVSRVWVVTVEQPLPPSIVPGSMINLDGWDASGAVLRDSWFHGVEDGIRWKSSNGLIENLRWDNPLTALSGKTGLEITPISSFYEGPFEIKNVTIRGNTFTGLRPSQAGDLITYCKGFPHEYNYTGCSGIAQIGNRYVPGPPQRGGP